jgi:hydroxymethylbilane synthase
VSGADIAIGSRGSALALAQARLVDEALRQQGHASHVVVIETAGDRRAPDTAWGEGAFVAAIERALLDGTVDIAVHSAKDVPTDQDARLRIAAYLPRADPRDALVVRIGARERRLADLAPGARVGTDSPRRTGFLLAARPDLNVHPLHGNVDTRLRRLDAAETDALVLACAGLDRLGLGDRIAERLDPELVPPAPGQGAIAVQVRAADERVLAIAATIDDPSTRQAVEAERTFLALSGGGCRSPIGALATIAGDEIHVLGGYASPEGEWTVIARRSGHVMTADALSRELAAELQRQGDGRTTRKTRELADTPPMRPRVLVTRSADQADELLSALRAAGLDPILVPAIDVAIDPPGGDLDATAARLASYRWVVVTSANGARATLGAAARAGSDVSVPSWAAIGAATADALEHDSIRVAFRPSRSTGVDLATELPLAPGDRVLVVRGDLASESVAATLRERGAEVDDIVAYRTTEAPERSRGLLRAAAANGLATAVIFTSGSTVRGLVALADAEHVDVRSMPAICIGPGTADEARRAGFHVLAVSPTPDSVALAATAAAALAAVPQEIA